MPFEKRIKGIVVKEPGVIEIKDDIILPEINDYEVLCRNLVGALCTGTDLSIISGKNQNVCYPTILGHESVGRVVAIGKKVRSYKVGDIVTSPRILNTIDFDYHSNWGGLCEYGIASDYKKMLADGYKGCLEMYYCNQVVPEQIDIGDAVMSITWSETCAYLDRIGLRQNERVLLLGSGAVALSFALMLQLGKIRVCIVGSRRYQARFATLDEAEYIDYSDYQAMEKLRASNKSSFDCIIDAVGDRKTTENCLELLKENGKLCLYGLKDGKLYEYFRQRRFGEHFYVYDESYSVKHAYKEVFGMIQEKQLYSEQWFDKIYELSDIQKALEDLENRKAMKVLFRFPSE